MRQDRYRKTRRIPAIALLALAWIGAGATPLAAQQPRTITLDEAIVIALRQNATVLKAENAAELQAAEVTRQKGQFLPDLRVSAQGTRSAGRNFSQSEGGIITETTGSLSAGISSSVTLFDGLRNVANLRSAEYGEAASLEELERARQTVVLDVATKYLALAEAEGQVEVQRESLAAHEAEEAHIRAFVEAGSRPIADLYQQQANVASARAALVEAERVRGRAETDLLATLQLDPTGEYRFPAPEIDGASAAAADVALDELIARALASRPELDALAARQAAAEQSLRAAGAARWPTVSLNAGYNTGATTTSALSLADQLDQRRGGSIGVSVSIPLIDGFNTRTAEAQARIQVENARIDLEQQRQQVGLEVRRAWLDHRAAEAQLRAAEAQLEAAELALETTRERYQAGVATLLEVTQARATLVQAASARVAARYGVVLQRLLLDYYVGAIDPRTPAIG